MASNDIEVPFSKTAHVLGKTWRSSDIQIHEDINFSGLLLSDKVLYGLTSAGFVRPSPIQLQAIPLGRSGLDLIVQAKSGTGKTCVFAIVALEKLLLESKAVQALVLAPTREVAIQICQVVRAVGSGFKGLQCHAFIGGMPLQEDKIHLRKCHIAVGTPGRIKQLIKQDLLKTNSVRLFVLDEADKLMEDSFQESINWIYSSLPVRKQMLALSATYPEELAALLQLYMASPSVVRLNADMPALIGVTQYYISTPYHPMLHACFQSKTEVLVKLLNRISFSQCLVFSNYQTRAESLCDELRKRGWPTDYISGGQEQTQRIRAIDKLKDFKCRVLVSTDVTSRGIDAENVNLIINMDVPWEVETYLHRIGRAGRFGSRGLAVTLMSGEEETGLFNQLKEKGHLDAFVFPDPMPEDLWTHEPDHVLQDHLHGDTVSALEEKDYEKPDSEVSSPVDQESCEKPSITPSLCFLSDMLNQKPKVALEQVELEEFKESLTWSPQGSTFSSFSYDQLMHDFDTSFHSSNQEEKVLESEDPVNEATRMLSQLNSFLIGNHEEFRIKMEDGFDVCTAPTVNPDSETNFVGSEDVGNMKKISPCFESTVKANGSDNLQRLTSDKSFLNESKSEECSQDSSGIIPKTENYSDFVDKRNVEKQTLLPQIFKNSYDNKSEQKTLLHSSSEQLISKAKLKSSSSVDKVTHTKSHSVDNILGIMERTTDVDCRLQSRKAIVVKCNSKDFLRSSRGNEEFGNNSSKGKVFVTNMNNVTYCENRRSEESETGDSDSSVGSDDSGKSLLESEDSKSESSEENYFLDQKSSLVFDKKDYEQFYQRNIPNNYTWNHSSESWDYLQHWWKPNTRMSAYYQRYNHYMTHMLFNWLKP